MTTLPDPASHALPTSAAICVPVPAGGIVVHRLLESSEPRLRDFEPSRSRSQALREGIPELFRVSVSHWLEEARAAAVSVRRVCFIAEVHLPADRLIRLAAGGEPGHVDVWAHPEQLLSGVRRVARLRGRP